VCREAEALRLVEGCPLTGEVSAEENRRVEGRDRGMGRTQGDLSGAGSGQDGRTHSASSRGCNTAQAAFPGGHVDHSYYLHNSNINECHGDGLKRTPAKACW
jgi:hypothetical protein